MILLNLCKFRRLFYIVYKLVWYVRRLSILNAFSINILQTNNEICRRMATCSFCSELYLRLVISMF